MKNYNEMASNVIRRSKEYKTAQKRRRKVIKRTITSLSCFCLFTLLCVGVWQIGLFDNTPPSTIENSIISGEDVHFDDKGNLPEKFKGYTVLPMSSQNDYAFLPTMDNIVAYSEYSVIGTVKGTEYVSLGTHAWTALTVSVEETLSGNIMSGTDIKVYTYGGYIPLREKLGGSVDAHGINMTDEEIDNTVVYEYADETELPKIGAKYVFYLVDGNDNMENGSYEGLFGKYGRLEVSGDSTEFTRKNSSGQTEKYKRDDLLKKH